MFAHKEPWGYSVWVRVGVTNVQVGAGVGLDIRFRFGRDLTKTEARLWRKRGVIRLL